MTLTIIFLALLACLFIVMYVIAQIHRKKYQDWYKEVQLDYHKCLNNKIELMDGYKKDTHEIKKLILRDMQKRQELYQNFTEWIEGLETQTLTDELKEEIIRNADFNMD